MNKDVIYIDVEDDITAIIGKVKASKEKIVALVPPKRVGILQSAVNLRLLNRAAKQGDKHLALVTSNHALMSIAASAGIPVAKNLQSKPELAEIPAISVDDDNDIIDGNSLPVGVHAAIAGSSQTKDEAEGAAMASALAEAPKEGAAVAKPKVKSGPKVPNFNKFRKRLVIIIAGVVLLIAFLIWAFFFAPRATVVISAKTSPSAINIPVTIDRSLSTSADKNIIKAAMKEKSVDKTTELTATGKKDAGKKAGGTVRFSNSRGQSIQVPAGTVLKTNDLGFATDGAATIPAATVCPDRPAICPGTVDVGVTAAENGSKYNAATGSLSGAPGGASASFAGPTSGGVTKMVTILTAADVQKAKTQIAEESTTSVRDELKQEFGEKALVLDDSFAVTYGDVKTSVNVGEEADKVTLSSKVIYRLYGVERAELSTFLDDYMKKELKSRDDQRVYKNGSDGAQFESVEATQTGAKATLVATAQIGPKIEDKDVKEQVRGKRYGEIQQNLESVQGIDAVDVKFFPFWVSTVPDDLSRITIEFKIDESN